MRTQDKQYLWAVAATAIVAIIGMTAIIIADWNIGAGSAYDLDYESSACEYAGRFVLHEGRHYDLWYCGEVMIREDVNGNSCVRTYTSNKEVLSSRC